ncbi:MAG: hypothetical protein CSB55_02830 [Candidatus Cloacimonadota bacterium]|nr:MAG: hypothetical protein CSB55_02830 [Candidatus Cloacimonadota bacterium]
MKEFKDWKDIAGSYYDKAFSLAVLFSLFAFLVSPKMQVKPFERKEVVVNQVEELPPEIKEKIEPPKAEARPVVEIVIDDEFSDDEEEELEEVSTIASTVFEDEKLEVVTRREEGKTSDFAVFEKAPQAIKQVPPVYPDFARKLGLQGKVVVRAEIFEDGSVGAVKIIKSLMDGPGGLDEAAITAVKQWKFQPGENGGKPIACWVTFAVVFNLD